MTWAVRFLASQSVAINVMRRQPLGPVYPQSVGLGSLCSSSSDCLPGCELKSTFLPTASELTAGSLPIADSGQPHRFAQLVTERPDLM